MSGAARAGLELERDRLVAELDRVRSASYDLTLQRTRRLEHHAAFMEQQQAKRTDVTKAAVAEVESLLEARSDTEKKQRRLSQDIIGLDERHRSLTATRRHLAKALEASEARASESRGKLKAVMEELRKLKVAITVKEVHDAATDLRQAKRRLELQSMLDADQAAIQAAVAEPLKAGVAKMDAELAAKYKPLIRQVHLQCAKDLKKLERQGNARAQRKAKQLADKASKRFEEVIWPALLQLETSTRAQQHAAEALRREFEARQAALGEDAQVELSLADLAGFSPGSPDTGLRSSPERGLSGGLAELESLAYRSPTADGGGSDAGVGAGGGSPRTAGGSASVRTGVLVDSDKLHRLKVKVFKLCTKPAPDGTPADLPRTIRFLKSVQQEVDYSPILDQMYRAERSRVLHAAP